MISLVSWTQDSLWRSALVMFLQCFPISPKDPFAFCPLLRLSLISRFLIFSSLCLYLRLCHLHTNILVSLILYILDSPHSHFLFTSGFVLNSCKRGTYNYCFRFCSSPNPSFAVLIFTVRERNLWNIDALRSESCWMSREVSHCLLASSIPLLLIHWPACLLYGAIP